MLSGGCAHVSPLSTRECRFSPFLMRGATQEKARMNTTHDAKHDHIPQFASHSLRLLRLLLFRFLRPVTGPFSRVPLCVGIEGCQRLVQSSQDIIR